MFENLTARFSSTFSRIKSKGLLKSSDLLEMADELKAALLDSDVALDVAEKFAAEISSISESQLEEFNKNTNPATSIFNLIQAKLVEILGGDFRRINFAKKPPTVILLTGLQGAGKTSLAGKLANWLKAQGNTPLLVASDLQRPNAVDQLKIVGSQAGVQVFAPEPGNGVGNPVEVAKDSIKLAQKNLHDFVIVDTAGRLAIDEELTKQAHQIRKAINPQETLLVIDSMIGQDSVVTAQNFLEKVGFDGIVLTKLDGDARGGAARLATRSVHPARRALLWAPLLRRAAQHRSPRRAARVACWSAAPAAALCRLASRCRKTRTPRAAPGRA